MANEQEAFVTTLGETRIEWMPLGGHVEHDHRSRQYPALEFAVAATQPIVSALHSRRIPPFSQGSLGSCTGNAEAGLLMTDPYYQKGRISSEEDAVKIYEMATEIDRIPGGTRILSSGRPRPGYR